MTPPRQAFGGQAEQPAAPTPEPKPCPFCGGSPKVKYATNGTAWSWIECQDCGAKGPAEYIPHGGNPGGAWNKRKAAAAPETADQRDRLKIANEHWHTRVGQLNTDNEALLQERARLVAVNEKLVTALDDIAKGMVPAGKMPSLDDPAKFRGEMWSWSQEHARAVLAEVRKPETEGAP